MKTEYDDRTEWTVSGIKHRINGPAISWKDGTKAYYINGILHREDGPAIIWPPFKEYFIHGNKLSKKEFDMRRFIETL